MKAITLASAGADPQVAHDIPVPEPGEDQILVRAVYAAVNPVDTFMAQTGAMVLSYPFTPGCDTAGVVVAAGRNAVAPLGGKFKEGDRVFGCTRLGTSGFGAWGEFLLMDARLAIPVPPRLSLEEASTLGVALLTAARGVCDGLGVSLPSAGSKSSRGAASDEPSGATAQQSADRPTALVFGGASSVGFAAVQLLLASGFSVVATCSSRSMAMLESRGVRCVSYALEESELIEHIVTAAVGKLPYLFDAVGKNHDLVLPLLNAAEEYTKTGDTATQRTRTYKFTTTNAFAPLPARDNLEATPIQIGAIGQPGEEAKALNDALSSYIPVLFNLLETRTVGVGPYQVTGEGIEGILGAWEVQKGGKVAGKVAVKIAEE